MINNKRRKIAEYYFNNLNNKKIYLFNGLNKDCCFHQFVVLVKEKKFYSIFEKKQIPFGFHYPYSIHKLKAIKNFSIDRDLKNSLLISSRCISLPIDPYLNKKQLSYITKKINLF